MFDIFPKICYETFIGNLPIGPMFDALMQWNIVIFVMNTIQKVLFDLEMKYYWYYEINVFRILKVVKDMSGTRPWCNEIFLAFKRTHFNSLDGMFLISDICRL